MKNIFIKVLLFLMIAVSAQAQNTQPKPSTNVGRAATTQATEVVSIAVFIDSNGRRVARPLLPNEAKKLVRDTQILTQSNGVLNLSGGGGSVVLPTPNLSGYATTTAMNAADAGLQTNINYEKAQRIAADSQKVHYGVNKDSSFNVQFTGYNWLTEIGWQGLTVTNPDGGVTEISGGGIQVSQGYRIHNAIFQSDLQMTLGQNGKLAWESPNSTEQILFAADTVSLQPSRGLLLFQNELYKLTETDNVKSYTKYALDNGVKNFRIIDDTQDVLVSDYTIVLKFGAALTIPRANWNVGRTLILVNSAGGNMTVNSVAIDIQLNGTVESVITIPPYTAFNFQSIGDVWVKIN